MDYSKELMKVAKTLEAGSSIKSLIEVEYNVRKLVSTIVDELDGKINKNRFDITNNKPIDRAIGHITITNTRLQNTTNLENKECVIYISKNRLDLDTISVDFNFTKGNKSDKIVKNYNLKDSVDDIVKQTLKVIEFLEK